MRTDLGRIRAKVDYLLSRDDVALAPNIDAEWESAGLREPLDDATREPAERLLDALDGRRMGQLWFYAAKDRYPLIVDDSETEWQGEHDWICLGVSEMADTNAILLHARTGETVFYDHDAWDWDFRDNFIVVKDSLAAFVDDVVLGLDYRLLYYQNLVELAVVMNYEDPDYPGIEADPWHWLVQEMHTDLFAGDPTDRERRRELLRRIESLYEDEDCRPFPTRARLGDRARFTDNGQD